jgi:hypothetical protein
MTEQRQEHRLISYSALFFFFLKRKSISYRRRRRRPIDPGPASGGGDGDLHAGLAVTGEAADEVVGAALQRDAVVAGGERPGAPRRSARAVPRRAHGHHIVRLGAVLEHCASTIVSARDRSSKLKLHSHHS